MASRMRILMRCMRRERARARLDETAELFPEFVMATQDRLEIAIIENVPRTDLNSIEEAGGYRDLIERFGFLWEDKRLRRAGMDYLDHVDCRRHRSWSAFAAERAGARLVLLTTKGDEALTRFAFKNNDVLLLGRESGGVPDEVHRAADKRVMIPMASTMRFGSSVALQGNHLAVGAPANAGAATDWLCSATAR